MILRTQKASTHKCLGCWLGLDKICNPLSCTWKRNMFVSSSGNWYFRGGYLENKNIPIIFLPQPKSLQNTTTPPLRSAAFFPLVHLTTFICTTSPLPLDLRPVDTVIVLMDKLNAPLEVGRLSHYLPGFLHPRWVLGFFFAINRWQVVWYRSNWQYYIAYIPGFSPWLLGDYMDVEPKIMG